MSIAMGRVTPLVELEFSPYRFKRYKGWEYIEFYPSKDFDGMSLEDGERAGLVPIKEPISDWSIRHIKPDDYKCGRDAALTILYRDIGSGYYEYKYAICNPKDQFSRSIGRDVAVHKTETWKVYCDNKDLLFRTIHHHITLTTKTSEEFRSLVYAL